MLARAAQGHNQTPRIRNNQTRQTDCKRAEKEGNGLVESYEEKGGRYQVSCEKHGTLVYCTNMIATRECMKDATAFCDECREINSGRND